MADFLREFEIAVMFRKYKIKDWSVMVDLESHQVIYELIQILGQNLPIGDKFRDFYRESSNTEELD